MLNTIALAAALSMAPTLSPPSPARLLGDWILNLYIGNTVFADEVTVRPGTDGALGGTLTVPGRFTADITHVEVTGTHFSFEITADEGRGPFRVRYAGNFHADEDVYVGFATLPDDNDSLLGGFVGRRR